MAVTAHHLTAPPVLKVVGAHDRPRELAIGRARQARRQLEARSPVVAPGAQDRFAHLRRSYD